MINRCLVLFIILWYFCISVANAKNKPLDIIFWHSMSGQLGDTVQQLIEDFNSKHWEYRIVPIYKGEYVETLTGTAAAFRAHRQPDLVQIFEVGTACMTFPKGIIIPVSAVLNQASIQNLENKLLPTIKAYYSDGDKLLAMPFNVSSAVMFYNKSAFKKAGLDSEHPPKTWPELADAAKKLLEIGYECGFTTAWPSWVQLETFCAWHNLPYATEENGFQSVDAKLIYNHPLVIHHVEQFSKWQKEKIFCYGGRNSDAEALFTSEKAPILFESSGARTSFMQQFGDQLGVASLPYWQTEEIGHTSMIGGGAIWVMAGIDQAKLSAIADFFNYLLSLPVQVKWQEKTGYIPVTKEAVSFLKNSNYFKLHPGAEVAVNALNIPTTNSKGIRLGGYTLIRQINDTALEAIWSGKKTAKQGLRDAIEENNRILKQFKENASS